ncbi:MAG: hypothetical protein KF718_24515 [Polyangiaceae bacterium]|nr:hypothetical protein [Polyangiaceae bacterium]
MQRDLRTRLGSPGRASLAVLCYFAATIVANSAWWWLAFDDWMLELRRWDYGWELMLPWAAREGRWVGRELSYPIGPLWQALAALPTLGAPFSGARTVAGLHLIFPLLSLATCAGVAFSQPLGKRRRALLLAGLSLFALHDDVRTFRAVLPVAVLVAYALDGDARGAPWRRAAFVGLLVTLGFALSFDTGVLSAVSVCCMGAYELLVLRRGRAALVRLAESLLGIGIGQAALALVLWWVGGSYLGLITGSLAITRAYGSAMVLAPSGYDPSAALAFVLVATLLAAASARLRLQPVVGIWLAGALPLAYRAVLRSDAEHLYAGLVPLAQVLVLVACRTAREHRPLAASAALLVTIFGLAWFGSHADRPGAWQPTRWLALGKQLFAPSAPEYRGEFAAIRGYVQAHREELTDSCVSLPASAEALHALTGVPGPAELVLGWSGPMQLAIAERVRAARCPRAVREIIAFDGQNGGFTEVMLAHHELYEPEGLIGADLVASRLRARPVTIERRPLPADFGDDERVTLPARVEIPLGRRIRADGVVRIEYSLELGDLRLLAGGAPLVRFHFSDGERPLSPAMTLLGGLGARVSSVLPVVAELAEWRWVAGREARRVETADRLVLTIEPRRLSPGSVRIRVHSLVELNPGDEPTRASPSCEPSLDLVQATRDGAVHPRQVVPSLEDHGLAMRPNPPGLPLAEAFYPLAPCAGSCLSTTLSVRGDDSEVVRVEAHVIDGHERPRVVLHEAAPGAEGAPIELALEPWADRRVALRLGVTAPAGSTSNHGHFSAPRVVPCTTVADLGLLVTRGDVEVTSGRVERRGAALEIHPQPRGSPPTEVLLALRGRQGHCVKLDATLRQPNGSATAALDVGVLEGSDVARLTRVELGRDEPSVALIDLPLAEWHDRWVKLRLASWALTDDEPTVLRVEHLRVHRCAR